MTAKASFCKFLKILVLWWNDFVKVLTRSLHQAKHQWSSKHNPFVSIKDYTSQRSQPRMFLRCMKQLWVTAAFPSLYMGASMFMLHPLRMFEACCFTVWKCAKMPIAKFSVAYWYNTTKYSHFIQIIRFDISHLIKLLCI